jgi:ribosomal RNA-processing protein 8
VLGTTSGRRTTLISNQLVRLSSAHIVLRFPTHLDVNKSAMFAVPGWAVSPESLVSTSAHEAPSAGSITDNAHVKPLSKPRKRKRNEPEPGLRSRLTSEDLHKLWNKEFGARSNVKQNSVKARRGHRHQNQAGADLGKEEHTPNQREGKYSSNADNRENSDLKNALQKYTGPKTEKKRNKSRDVSTPKQCDDRALEKLETNGKADAFQHSEHGKIGGNTQPNLQKQEVQHALQKIEEKAPLTTTKLTPLQAKMRDKLTSARFRHLNETLYTSSSSTSLDLFTASPDLFAEYHTGFAQQVKDSWPENPVDGYVRDIKARATPNRGMDKQNSATGILPLPRRKTGSCTIADLGCGDAPLARAFQSKSKALHLKFHSFDLHASNPLVTKADIADLPLRDGEADIAVFCLSLMGTNWISFIEESWRVLRGDGKGELWVAEVKSRFKRISRGSVVENSVGKKRKSFRPNAKQGKGAVLAEDDTEAFVDETPARDETDVAAFRNVVERRGFTLQPGSVNMQNKMFVSMIFNKSGVPAAGRYLGWKWNGHEYETSDATRGQKKFIDMTSDGDGFLSPEEESKALKPCVYKKR